MRNRKYDLFLSYSPLNTETVQSLASELNFAGVSVWFDQWKLVPGQNWQPLIERAMTESAAIGVCIGPSGNDKWPERDLSLALSIQQQDPSFKIIPILLPEADVSDIPAVISRIKFLDLRKGPTDPETIERVKSALNESADEPLAPRSLRRVPLVSSIPRSSLVGFVARRDSEGRDLVERLKEELAPDKGQVIVLWGAGGVGKTTLAAEAARALSDDFTQRVIWINATDREDFVLSTLLDEIATQLDRADLRRLPIETKENRVRDILSLASTLVVIDNFEVVEPDEQRQSLDWLSKLARCSVLVVSREKIEGQRNLPVEAMSREEAGDFLQRLIGQTKDPSTFDRLNHEQIMRESERNPLVMQWVVAQIDLARDPNSVLDELANGVGNAAQRVFDRSFELVPVDNDGRAVLLVLSLFAPDASRSAVADVAGFGEDVKRLNEAVKRLAALWLVRTTAGGQRLALAGLTRELAKSRLIKDEHADEYRRRFVAYFLRYAEAHAQPTPEDYDLLETEKGNLLSALDVAFDLEDWESVQTVAYLIASAYDGMLTVRGYWDEALERSKQALEAARFANDEWGVAQFAGNTGALQQDLGEYDEARKAHTEALTAFRKLGSDSNISVALHQLAILAQTQGELDNARQLYNESLEIKKKLGDERGIAATLHQLGNLAQDEGNLQEALKLYDQSIDIKRKLPSQSGLGVTLHELANLAQARGDRLEARRLYNESLGINKQLGDQIGIAVSTHALGQLVEKEGNKVEAGQLFREALAIFEKLKSPNADIARRDLERVEADFT